MRISDWNSDVCSSDLVALSTSPVAPQLASIKGRSNKLNPDLVKFGMTVATPINVQSICPVMIGVDEAGRGPLDGPVVAAAVTLGEGYPQNLDDSKRISAKRRAVLDEAIRATCLRSEEHTSELQSLMRISYAVF